MPVVPGVFPQLGVVDEVSTGRGMCNAMCVGGTGGTAGTLPGRIGRCLVPLSGALTGRGPPCADGGCAQHHLCGMDRDMVSASTACRRCQAPGQRRWAPQESQRRFPWKGGDAVRWPLAPDPTPQDYQLRPQPQEALPAACPAMPGHRVPPPRAACTLAPATLAAVSRRTACGDPRLLIEKETYTLLWCRGPCCVARGPARVTFSSTAVQLAG